jgi:serine/threonine protein kinase
MNFIGQQISHYQIQALLGQGRVGTVYQAINLEDQDTVALKVVSLHLAQQPEFRQRFLSEVRALPELDHPSIVSIHEAGIDTNHDILYLTMDYVHGRSLSAYRQQLIWRGEPLRVGDSLLIAAQIADALAYAHSKGVLHQDIRPNVILFKTPPTGHENQKLHQLTMLSDFALASLLEAEAEPFPATLPYLSPERCLRQPADGRSDIYALGIILYELITGQQPFSITNLDDAIRCHTQIAPPEPAALRPDLPPRVNSVILKAMAKRPSDRYQTADEFAEALRDAADTLPETLASAQPGEEIRNIDTVAESAAEQAIHISQWTSNEDRLIITQDLPRILNRRIVTIGRGEDNDIVLPSLSVTRRHAQLERADSGWQVRDLGSRNGTFLDGAPLLPNIPMEVLPHQILRVGPYYMQFELGKGYAQGARPYEVFVNPTEMEIAPGRSRRVQVTISNRTTAVEEYTLTVERLPLEWVSVPNPRARLNPGEQATLEVEIRLPLSANGAAPLGKQQYLMVVRAATAQLDMIAAPGTLNIYAAADEFSLELHPARLINQGECYLMLRNEGSVPQSYTVIGRATDQAVKFVEWRPIARAAADQPATPAAKQAKAGKSGRRLRLQTPPVLRRILSAPQRWWRRIALWPRQTLNRVMPGLGNIVPNAPMPNLPKGMPKREKETAVSPQPPAFSPNDYKKTVYYTDLRTQANVAPHQQEMVRLGLSARKRPWFSRHNKTLPYEFYVATPNGRSQTLSGELEVRPRIRTHLPAALLILLLLFTCSASVLLYGYLFNPTFAAFLATPSDIDGDGLSNLQELYLYRTNPFLADSDGDGLTDSYEINLGLNPNRADSDGDGLSDAEELRLNTNPLAVDTDGDGLPDGLEVHTLFTDPLTPNQLPVIISRPTALPGPTATPTAEPTARPTAVSSPTPSTSQLRLSGIGSLDGAIRYQGSSVLAVNATDPTLPIGDTAENQTNVAILSFQTSDLPDDALNPTVQLRLFVSEQLGNPSQLGQIHLDIAPLSGFSGSPTLEATDVFAPALVINLATLQPDPAAPDWYIADIPQTAVHLLNWRGVTQFRISYTLSSNGNGIADTLLFASGDATRQEQQPQLLITYGN